MLREDNSGFVHFPTAGKFIQKIDFAKTFVYLVAFHPIDLTNKNYILSNLKLDLIGSLSSDDVSIKKSSLPVNNLEDLVENQLQQNEFEARYFPNELDKSIPLTSAICIGWSEDSFEFKDGSQWSCTFRDLTGEGQKLYYSIKKLHNNKEVRILTFNNI